MVIEFFMGIAKIQYTPIPVNIFSEADDQFIEMIIII
jgi:hypothetical protein